MSIAVLCQLLPSVLCVQELHENALVDTLCMVKLTGFGPRQQRVGGSGSSSQPETSHVREVGLPAHAPSMGLLDHLRCHASVDQPSPCSDVPARILAAGCCVSSQANESHVVKMINHACLLAR